MQSGGSSSLGDLLLAPAAKTRLLQVGRRGDAGSAVAEAVLQGHRGGAVAGIALASGRHGYGSLGNGKEAEVGGMDTVANEKTEDGALGSASGPERHYVGRSGSMASQVVLRQQRGDGAQRGCG